MKNSITKSTVAESTKISKVLFWHLPLIIIFTMNIGFFILTALKIFRVKREVKESISKDQVNTNREK